MRRTIIRLGLGIGVLLGSALAAHGAFADGNGAITQTQHFPTTTHSFTTANPCTGATGTVTLTEKGVSHTTVANGIVHFTNTFEGTFVFVPDDPSQATVTGHTTSWDGGSFNVSAGVGVDRFTQIINGRGTDGSHVQLHENAYATVDANGNPISIKFDHVEMSCG